MKLQKARDHARLLLPSEIGEIPAISLEHALEEYLRSLSTRTRTATEYERLLKRHFIPTLGHRRISEMVARDILAVTNKLLHAPTECRHAHVAMQTFLNWCVPRYLTASPMAGLKTPTKPSKRAHPHRRRAQESMERPARPADAYRAPLPSDCHAPQ
jgi:hypothetical protein